MQGIDPYSYLNGICVATYFVVCLLCGLQLCFNCINCRRTHDFLLSRLVGSIYLVMACSALCYILSDVLHCELLLRIGTSIDIFVFSGIACVSYVLYSNNEPSRGRLAALAWPFVVIGVLNICFPQWLVTLFHIAAFVLLIQMLYFGVIFIRRERHLDDLYADPERHSLKWMLVFIGLFIGWWIVCFVFSRETLLPWYDVAVYLYMAVIMLYAFTKVSNHAAPVSLETQLAVERLTPALPQREGERPTPALPHREGEELQQLEERTTCNSPTGVQPTTCNLQQLEERATCNSPTGVQPACLQALMEEEQLYLNPDLTVEDVVKRLGTNTKYFSAMLHNEMHTTFSRFVNEYRVARAQQLLQDKDVKVVSIAERCGFNSTQSFYRTFIKHTGHTPNEWRKN